MTKEHKIVEYLKTVSNILGHGITASELKYYIKILSKYEFTEIADAIDYRVDSSRFFPTPNEISGHIKEMRSRERMEREADKLRARHESLITQASSPETVAEWMKKIKENLK